MLVKKIMLSKKGFNSVCTIGSNNAVTVICGISLSPCISRQMCGGYQICYCRACTLSACPI